ncbi:hypothetical protein AAVH_40759 [Aphelenchoides avenae]|nr:hypothetical protein AAVH_40759 [Aphelenchus avenae]
MLPNESLLQVLHFADYKTLVLANLAGRRLLRLVVKFADELARRRRYLVYVYTALIEYDDVTIGVGGSIPYEPCDRSSLAAACRELAGAIGPHAVAILTFYGNTWNMPDVGVICVAAPALKCAEEVVLHGSRVWNSGGDFGAFMSNFAVMKSLGLWVNYGVFRQLNWAFLRRESARELRRIKVYAMASAWPKNGTHRAVEELVHDCATLPRLLCGDALELDFSDVCFSRSFGLRIIEVSI